MYLNYDKKDKWGLPVTFDAEIKKWIQNEKALATTDEMLESAGLKMFKPEIRDIITVLVYMKWEQQKWDVIKKLPF